MKLIIILLIYYTCISTTAGSCKINKSLTEVMGLGGYKLRMCTLTSSKSLGLKVVYPMKISSEQVIGSLVDRYKNNKHIRTIRRGNGLYLNIEMRYLLFSMHRMKFIRKGEYEADEDGKRLILTIQFKDKGDDIKIAQFKFTQVTSEAPELYSKLVHTSLYYKKPSGRLFCKNTKFWNSLRAEQKGLYKKEISLLPLYRSSVETKQTIDR
jgi:hypothetical protein